jgi:hypothetical protein
MATKQPTEADAARRARRLLNAMGSYLAIVETMTTLADELAAGNTVERQVADALREIASACGEGGPTAGAGAFVVTYATATAGSRPRPRLRA